MKSSLLLHFILVYFLLLITTTNSESIIKTLPGYPGDLPFKLETGYIGVGKNDEVQLFYYFIESERDPNIDPLVFWLTGGPGCSGFSGLVYEIGPLAFDVEAFDGSLPSLILNPYSWTKIASIIFIDSPVGTGFSYATKSEGYDTSDTKSATQLYDFLRQWLSNHPTFIKNRVYVAGDSYGGKMAPMVALEISKGNEDGLKPRISLQGYLIGNARMDGNEETNQRVPHAHRLGLVSDEYFELARNSCNGEYANPDANNIQCLIALQLVKKCINLINWSFILDPKCLGVASKHDEIGWGQSFPLIEDDPADFDILLLSKQEEPRCRVYDWAVASVWANNETVQEALHIKEGTKAEWKRCNKTLLYEQDVETVFEYHQLLSDRGYQALAYSGDHDIQISYLSTLKWIRELNLTIDDEWRPWTVDGQVAGYTVRYVNNQAYLTFATVKGAGLTAPEFKPKECFELVSRWLSLRQP